MGESDAPPPHGELHRRIHETFSRQRLLGTLGARLVRVAPGEVDIALPFQDGITQQHGYVHAGAITTIADTACGYAALTKMPVGSAVLTVEFKVNLLEPAEGKLFLARARVVRSGRTLTITAADVHALDREGETGTVVATMLATMMRLPARAGRED